ncbi:MAG: hypothetical protein KatS3mg077_1891 [Candidatus Binatia bacterium]|nr:MAG: hypothetical protein KatS3mg077_1891 [Candidatus Binatia bacterium]
MRESVSEQLRAGLIGAVLATTGDAAQLYVATGGACSEVACARMVWAGTVLGVVGIALYGFGYRARAALVASVSETCARWVANAGAMFAATGATVHGTTGLLLSLGRSSEPHTHPLQGVLQSGPVSLSLWGLAAVFLVVAAGAELFATRPWTQRFVNPLVATLWILAISSLLPHVVGHVVGAASVNIAHVVFFGWCLVAERSWPSRLLDRETAW